MKGLLFTLLMISSVAQAQEQLSVRFNEQGIMRVLHMAVKYNTAANNSRSFDIPQKLYKFTLKNRDLEANPIVATVNEFSDLDLHRDLNFYLQTNPIKITGLVDQKSLKLTLSKSHADGFDVRVSMTLPKVTVAGSSLSLCEDRLRNSQKCGPGLKATVTDLLISTKNKPVILNALLRVKVKGHMAGVRVVSVSSNIDGSTGPGLNLSFGSVIVPKVSIVINDQETELDTSKLKSVIMSQKQVLAKKLLGFASDYIAEDLAEMINIYLANIKTPTRAEVLHEENPVKEFSELDFDYPTASAIDSTFVRPSLLRELELRQKAGVKKKIVVEPVKDTMQIAQEQMALVIHNAIVSLSLNSIKTFSGKDLQIGGAVDMVLNDQTLSVKNRLGNKDVEALPPLELANFRQHDLNLVISEPMVNGALDLVNKTGLFQELFTAIAKVKGFSVGKVQADFGKDRNLKLVANVQVDLKKVASDNLKETLKQKWATLREESNNGSKIYFPLEFIVVPSFTPVVKGQGGLSLYVKSPFQGNELTNSFGYPSNFTKMHNEVKAGVTETLQEKLASYTNKAYSVDIGQFINQSKVVFEPKSISIEQGAYLLINLDIADIKFNSLNPKKK